MNFRDILPVIALGSGVATTLQTYIDPFVQSGFITNDNLQYIDKPSDAGLTVLRMDDLTWGTGWTRDQYISPTLQAPVESQITNTWREVHLVKAKNDVGVMLRKSIIDADVATYAGGLQGYQYLQDRSKQAVAAVYDGHLHYMLPQIFQDHYIRSNDADNANMMGSVITFANDVTIPAQTLQTDLNAPETTPGENGGKLYAELSQLAYLLTKDYSGRIVYIFVNQTTFQAFKNALNAWDRQGRATVSRGDIERDNVKYTIYQTYINMNDLRIVGLKDDYVPDDGTLPGKRCLVMTRDAVKVGVVRYAFQPSIIGLGLQLSGGALYTQQNGMSWDEIESLIIDTDPYLSKMMADQSGRADFINVANQGSMSDVALTNCITMSLERIGAIPGNNYTSNYYLNAQMRSTVVRHNPSQLFELKVPNALIPTAASSATSAAATRSSSRKSSNPAMD